MFTINKNLQCHRF